MKLYYPNMSYKTETKEVPVTFPAQSQSNQPGDETQMKPEPIFDNPNYVGTGKLKDKSIIITGGDSGIGRAVAVAYAKEGADISIVYYNENKDAEITKEYIENLGRKCILIPGDLQNEDFCKDVAQKTFSEFKRLDCLVNNAGVQFLQDSLENITAEQLDTTFRVNVYSMFYITKAALKFMQKGSTIINTTSVTAYKGSPQLIDYSSTKGAIVSFTRSLALSLVSQGIRVNGVAPGPIWTALQPSSRPAEMITTFGADTSMQRAGQPVELAPTYVYLASDDSSYVTGQILHVDGGDSMSS